jgi:hypothetical protein
MKRTFLSALLILISLFSVTSTAGISASSDNDEFSPSDLDQNVYLPIVVSRSPLSLGPFGVEIFPAGVPGMLEFASDLDTAWVRAESFSWKDIEPVRTEPPTYLWEQAVNETYLQELAARGMTVIATIKFTPDWAQKIEGSYCGPIAEHALDEYTQFAQALVSRYGAPPYNIKYWEFGNEPDVDPIYVPPTSFIGCWGDETTEYNGGDYYAVMLQHVYPAIKAVDPSAKVMIGGLLLDCDPDLPKQDGTICRSGKFFEGILVGGGGDYFDIVSFHAYAFFYSGFIVDEIMPAWEHRGGVVAGKISFLQEIMEEYNVSKPLMLTEAGLRCPWYYEGNTSCSPPTNDFYERQADYVVWLYVRNWNTDVINTIWYTLNYADWQYTELLFHNDTPKPAYYAYQFLTQELWQAQFIRELAEYPDLRAYEFSTWGKVVWVLWATDMTEHLITLPDTVTQIYDKYGNPIAIPPDGQIAVDSPIYVELVP